MRPLKLGFVLFFATTGCAAGAAEVEAADEAAVTSSASVVFTADFQTKLTGRLEAGKELRVEYALERLPQCRGNVGGGGPGWAITGFYSQNNGPAKTFDPTALSADGRDRVTRPTMIRLEQAGDLSLWFQVTSVFGCSGFDSALGNDFHFDVAGLAPANDASIVFKKDGTIAQAGDLHAGGKVRVRYEQDRLPECRRVQQGNPLWAITGFASIDGDAARTFETARPAGSDRDPVDAVLDLPHSGELALWFQVVSVGGCMKFDSKSGANYRFPIN